MRGHRQGVAHASSATIVPALSGEPAAPGSLADPGSLANLGTRAMPATRGLLWPMESRPACP
jgi:hypothetical protein